MTLYSHLALEALIFKIKFLQLQTEILCVKSTIFKKLKNKWVFKKITACALFTEENSTVALKL